MTVRWRSADLSAGHLLALATIAAVVVLLSIMLRSTADAERANEDAGAAAPTTAMATPTATFEATVPPGTGGIVIRGLTGNGTLLVQGDPDYSGDYPCPGGEECGPISAASDALQP